MLNALPWARVERLTDGAGDPVALGPDPHTPLRLVLPPGSYRATLVNPSDSASQVVEVEIRAGETTRSTVALAPVDVDGYLAGALAGSP